MLFWILVGALVATWTTIGVLCCIGDAQHRAAWQRLIDDLEARHHG